MSGSRIITLLGFLSAAAFGGYSNGVSSPGDALRPQLPFAGIPVLVGASANSAARTLDQLKQILAEKVSSGEISPQGANAILARYGTILVIYAQNASAQKTATPAPVAPKTTQIISADPAATPNVATGDSNPILNAPVTPPKSEAMAAAEVTVNVSAFNELASVLSSRRRPRRGNSYAGHGQGTETFENSPSFPSFAFGGGDPAGGAVTDLRPVRRNGVPTAGALPNSAAVRKVTLAAKNAASTGTNGGLSAGGPFRMLAGWQGVADDDEPREPGNANASNWFFAAVLMGLSARAGWQWKRGRNS